MDIYEFQREDGSVWADFKCPRGVTLLRHLSANRLDEIERIGRREGGRIGALTRRAINDARERRTLEFEQPPIFRKRSFIWRLKWAFTGA